MPKQPIDPGSIEPPAVRVAGAVKRFGTTTALAGLDLQLRPGEWLGLLGRWIARGWERAGGARA